MNTILLSVKKFLLKHFKIKKTIFKKEDFKDLFPPIHPPLIGVNRSKKEFCYFGGKLKKIYIFELSDKYKKKFYNLHNFTYYKIPKIIDKINVNKITENEKEIIILNIKNTQKNFLRLIEKINLLSSKCESEKDLYPFMDLLDKKNLDFLHLLNNILKEQIIEERKKRELSIAKKIKYLN